MLAKDAKPGAIILQNEAPHIIETVHVQSPSARGGNTLYKFRAVIWSHNRRQTLPAREPTCCLRRTFNAAK